MHMLMRRARRRLQGEDGFTLIEVMFTIGILLVSLLSLAYTAAIAFTDISLARQRQGATGLANQTMEQLRALPFDIVKKGLDNSDLGTADPNISASGSGGSGVYRYGGEEIPHGDNAAVVPLVPHRANVVIGPTTYHRSVYVTYFEDNKTTNEFRVTVILTWDNAARRGSTAQVQIQTIVFSPAGCLSTATHPFSAPCQPFLYGTSQQEPGAVTITGTMNGVQLNHVSLVTARASSSMQIEQTSSIIGTAYTSGVTFQLMDEDEQTAGEQSVTSGADADPSTPGIEYQSATLPSQSATTLSDSGAGQSISVTSSGTESGGTTSTTTASSPSHLCADRTGTNQTDVQPCGSTSSKQAGQSSASLTTSTGGTAALATLAAVANPTFAFTNREVQASGDGWLHADLYRYLGTLSLGGLPSGLSGPAVPAGWNGYYVRVSSFTDAASAESGASTVAPAAATSGTISYWNGTGYSSLSLAPGAATSVPVAAVHITDPTSGIPPTLKVDITGSLSTGGTTKSDPANCGSSCARTTASATSNGPLLGTIAYKVTYAGNVLADLTITIDFGSISASSTYTAAPGA
jgi:hypothetical protein